MSLLPLEGDLLVGLALGVAPYLLKKGRTSVLSATPWIIDSTTVQNVVIIAIVSKLQRISSYIVSNLTDTQQKTK
jgi:hypothetical protein